MAGPSRARHNGRVTAPARALSRQTLELCDWLIDNITLAANHPDFDGQAKVIGNAKQEVSGALVAAGGVPIGARRQEDGSVSPVGPAG